MLDKDHWTITDLTEPFEDEFVSWEEILKAHETLLLELLPVTYIEEVNLFTLEDFVLSDHRGIDPKKELQVFCIYLMAEILHVKAALKDEKKDFLQNLYDLAEWRARYHIASLDLEHFDNQTEFRHRLRAQAFGDMADPQSKERYAEPKKKAESLWKKGNKKLIKQMTDHLITKYPDLSVRRLYRELLPLAKQYGKAWNPNASRHKKRHEEEPSQSPRFVTCVHYNECLTNYVHSKKKSEFPCPNCDQYRIQPD